MRVLYFTVTPLVDGGNGGSICCRNHVKRLAEDPAIELFAMVAGPNGSRALTLQFFETLGVTCHFQAFAVDGLHAEGTTIAALDSFIAKALYQFPWEIQALNQPHVDEGIGWAIRAYDIDTLIIDYHPSALFLKLPRADVRTLLIGLNREGDFYSDMIERGLTCHGPLTAEISLQRARWFEKQANLSVDKLIVIGPPDAPEYPLPSPPACITPFLDRSPDQWRYRPDPRLFFVGNIAHYPNKSAIEWIVERFAPELLALFPEAIISIVGAQREQVDVSCANVEFLGTADADIVRQLFLSANAMICPVSNDYGNKFKAIEALSFGTPLLASYQTLRGIPHLAENGAIDLDDPQAAARTAAILLRVPDALLALQAEQNFLQSRFIDSQSDIWSKTISTIALK